MRIVLLAVPALALLVAAGGCSSAPQSSGATSSPTASAVARASAPTELGTLVKSGFGQQDEYVWVTALVHNNSDYVGQTVTVTFNVLDSSGKILKSASQIESFSRPNASQILGTQVALLKGEKAAKVEAALLVEAKGTFSDKPFPRIEATDGAVVKQQFETSYSFTLANPLNQPLKSPRISVMCFDATGAINGGGMSFPEMVPANGKVKVDAQLLLSGEAAKCDAHIGAPSNWEGVAATSSPPAAAGGSAEEAFHRWVDQFAAHDWRIQYATLVTAQQQLLSEAAFLACRERDQAQAPKITWSKALSVVQVPGYTIPGTNQTVTATKVSAQLNANGVKVPIDAHMVDEGGTWKWSLTTEALTKCK